MKNIFASLFILTSFSIIAFTQVPTAVHIQILKAEDARRYDETLENLMGNAGEDIRVRAILAAGRIGDDRAVPRVSEWLNGTPKTAEMAAFALGEIESVKAADAILKILKDIKTPDLVRARAVEAAGKIAAANAKDERSKLLGVAILDTLETENKRGAKQNREVVLLALTATLRARPEKTDIAVAKFLTAPDARIRADAANTLSRIRAKNANKVLRAMLKADADPIARANAARALGAAEDKDAFDVLLNAATEDTDSRVRVSAIRSLASLKDAKAADKLLERGEKLLAEYSKAKKPNFIPVEQNEFIEIAVTLGRLLANTDNERADKLFADFGKIDKGHTPEAYIARVRVGPKRADDSSPELTDWRQYSTIAQIFGEFADIEPKSETGQQMKKEAPGILRPLAKAFAEADPSTEGKRMLAAPDVLQAYARFKTDDLGDILRTALKNKDVQTRATAAALLADVPPTKINLDEFPLSRENLDALRAAFEFSRTNDIDSNDAILAIVEALFKISPSGVGWRQELMSAFYFPDYIVRKKTFDLIPKIRIVIDSFPLDMLHGAPGDVRPYSGKGTKIGQVLNKNADYRRAALRKNGSVKAILTTEKGIFTIDLLPEDAPLTADNFIKLARSGYFNGLEVHRVVPNFVMQDGDPRGDGNGGPGWSIRCEINMVPYERGAVGMALSGKDTGGSQWFVTHSPQPHLDGGYTVFGKVNETGMKVVDNIVRGDKIISVKIVGR